VICGVDANVLIYSAVESMPEHRKVVQFFEKRVLTGEITCAVTFPILLEFIHITTDPKRFKPALIVDESVEIAMQYWTAENWLRLIPKQTTGMRTLNLLRLHRLGRKRLLDTYFAATLLDHDIRSLITCNPEDFKVFPEIDLIDPLSRS
jgi:predicted nucleic acid-binding protein